MFDIFNELISVQLVRVAVSYEEKWSYYHKKLLQNLFRIERDRLSE